MRLRREWEREASPAGMKCEITFTRNTNSVLGTIHDVRDALVDRDRYEDSGNTFQITARCRWQSSQFVI